MKHVVITYSNSLVAYYLPQKYKQKILSENEISTFLQLTENFDYHFIFSMFTVHFQCLQFSWNYKRNFGQMVSKYVAAGSHHATQLYL